MSTPSDLLRKANTAQYVINPSVPGAPIKNPAYYMQPPRANSSVWMPEPAHAPAMWSPQPDPTEAPTQALPKTTPPTYPERQPTMWNRAPAMPAAQPGQPLPYGQPRQLSQAAPPNSAPTVEKNDMRVSVQPPNIPAPIIPQKEPTIYRQLMQQHDRAAGMSRARK